MLLTICHKNFFISMPIKKKQIIIITVLITRGFLIIYLQIINKNFYNIQKENKYLFYNINEIFKNRKLINDLFVCKKDPCI